MEVVEPEPEIIVNEDGEVELVAVAEDAVVAEAAVEEDEPTAMEVILMNAIGTGDEVVLDDGGIVELSDVAIDSLVV